MRKYLLLESIATIMLMISCSTSDDYRCESNDLCSTTTDWKYYSCSNETGHCEKVDPLAIDPLTLPDATIGQSDYRVELVASGRISPYFFTLARGDETKLKWLTITPEGENKAILHNSTDTNNEPLVPTDQNNGVPLPITITLVDSSKHGTTDREDNQGKAFTMTINIKDCNRTTCVNDDSTSTPVGQNRCNDGLTEECIINSLLFGCATWGEGKAICKSDSSDCIDISTKEVCGFDQNRCLIWISIPCDSNKSCINGKCGIWSSVNSGTTNTLHAVWGSSADDVWAVGDQGTILHWNGTSWSSVTSNTTNNLRGVWGSNANDVWAVGEGCVYGMHWDGTAWSRVTMISVSNLVGVWGSTANDVWATGASDALLHWNGTEWSNVNSGVTGGYLGAVWGNSANDVWVVGGPGTILHYDGSKWQSVNSGTTRTLLSVWGSSANDVWAVGERNTLLHWNGTAWSSMNSGATNDPSLTGVWGSSINDVWAVSSPSGNIFHWNGTAWSSANNGATNALDSIWGSSSNDIWAVGYQGTIGRWQQ